jgi:hypothetical protein
MNSLGQRFLLIVALVSACATPAMANQPPGPGVSLPQILMLPLMALFTVLGGACSILHAENKARIGTVGKWVAVAVLFVWGFTHEFASMIVTCVFGTTAIYRGVSMVRWGMTPAASAPVLTSKVPGWRLITSGIAMCVVALFLMGSAVVFVGYWPDLYQGSQVSTLKRVLAFEIAFGRTQKEQTGETRFYRINPTDENVWYIQSLLRRGNVRVDFDRDDKHFTIYLLPYSKFPPWPYRHWTKQGSYRADETGQIRMIWAKRTDEVCPADAPVVMKVEEEDIREMMKRVYTK